jgi:hypothetical protein
LQNVTNSLAENSIDKRHLLSPRGLRMLSPNQKYAVPTKTRLQPKRPPSQPIPASTEPDDESVFNAAIELEQSDVLLLREAVNHVLDVEPDLTIEDTQASNAIDEHYLNIEDTKESLPEEAYVIDEHESANVPPFQQATEAPAPAKANV